MEVWMIILNELKEFFRDKMALTLMIIFPIILIYLLGNLLSDQDLADEVIGDLRIGYIIEVNSPMEKSIINTFIKESSEQENMEFTPIKERKLGREQVAGEKLDGLVVFEDNKILIYEGRNTIKNRTISATITGYSHLAKSLTTIMNTVPDKLTVSETGKESFVQEKEFNANRTMLDYYGVTMVLMMIFMGAINGVDTFRDEIQLKTINRFIVSPMRRSNIFIQKVVGKIPSAIIEVTVIMIVSTVFLDVHYAASLSNNLILIVLFLLTSFTVLIIGIVIGMYIKANPLVYVMALVWVMMFISGTFAKEIYIKGLSDIMPAYQILKAAFDITVFGRTDRAIFIMIIEAVIIMSMYIVGALRFSKMKEAR
jgi:ABC-2 type transport system permease protein